MENKEARLKFLKIFIRENRVCTFEKILQEVDYHAITLRRDIKSISGITSYTHRGKFITLLNIPIFDENGIWFYKEIGFTKFKNSLDLIINIINRSKEGITQEELEKLLKIKISKQIQILLRQNRLNRVKLGSRYCYLSEELAKDRERRIQSLNITIEEHYDKKIKISDLIAVLKVVLLEHTINMDDLESLIKKHSLDVSVRKLEQLLMKYNLSEKKTR
ncbi:MAG: hypothetical protein ACMUIP_13385 [bacterium]